MLLNETITNSINAINEKRAAQARKKSIEEFSAALATLNTICSQLETAITCMKELKKSGIISIPVMTSTIRDELLSSVDDCGSSIEDGSLSRDMVIVFKSHMTTAKVELNNAWEANASTYSDGPRGYLSMISGLTENPEDARELEYTICKITSGAISLKQIKDLVSSVAAANEIKSGFSLEPEIETFLKKVSSLQATVADLTPTIQKRLQEKGLMGKLKISF